MTIYQWSNAERSAGVIVEDIDGGATHAVIVEVGHERWGEFLSASPIDPPPPSIPIVPSKNDLYAAAAELRWRKEVAGIDFGGVPIPTDDRSMLMLAGARIAAMADPDFVTRWKTPAGWVELNATQIIAVSDAVQAHIAACFALEADVAAAIEAEQITTIEEVEAVFSADPTHEATTDE